MTDPVAYLAGVVAGDGYISHRCLGLHVADYDFALAFADAITAAFGRPVEPKQEGRYWRTRVFGTGTFDHLLTYAAETDEQRASWLRGFFDAEGNVNLTPKPATGTRSYDRRVSFYNTDQQILATATAYLTALGLPSRCRSTRPSQGHYGAKTVFEIVVTASQANFARFAAVIGSSIGRKQQALDRLAPSYSSAGELLAGARRMQAAGVVAKRKRRDENLPAVLDAIRAMHAADGKVTSERLRREVPGWWAQEAAHGYRRLVAMALGDRA